MTTTIDYALMAGVSYRSNRDPNNRFPIPSGWSEVAGSYRNLPSGFEAAAFTNGSEVVISFAGTDFSKGIPGALFTGDFWQGNIPLITGQSVNGADQLVDAVEYYLQVKNDPANAGKTISLTGHSLGGALASLVGVFFGVPATTFDQVPAYATALAGPAFRLREALIARGHTPTELAGLYSYMQQQQTDGGILGLPNVPNQNLVTNLYVNGEVTRFIPAFNIGTGAGISNNSSGVLSGVSSSDLHSQALLTTMLQSGDTSTSTASNHTLGQVTFKLTDLLKMIFDDKLFYHDPLSLTANAPVNFLERIVRHQTGGVDGVQAGGDAMVTRFTADLWKLAQDGGLTMSENLTYSNWNNISKALIAFAMQKYYEETNLSAGYKKELFTDLTTAGTGSNGIRFDIADVSQGLNTKITAGNVKYSDLVNDIKGFGQYFQTYLDTTGLLSLAERTLIKSLLPVLRDWYVQAGATGMNATDTLNNGAFMLGGNGQDTLTGGTKADLLVGNTGDDILKGGDGSDVLIGGAGVDTYAWKASANPGIDTILDSDKQGYLRDDTNGAIVLTGGSQLGDNRVFSGKDANGANHIYTFVTGDRNTGGDLIVDGAMLIKGYDPSAGNHMGITLDGPVAAANLSKLTGNGSDNYIVNDVRNKNADPQKHDTKYAEVDPSISGSGPVLEGGGGADIIVGQGGDDLIYADSQIDTVAAITQGNTGAGSGQQGDWLTGGSGNDTMVGSTGNDVLMGGGGSDLLIGGAGNDDISGDTNWVAQSFDWRIEEIDGIRWFIPAEGDSWPADSAADVIYAGEGNDHVWGGMGNDVIFGENGNDILDGNDGNDVVLGGEGNDIIQGDGSGIFGRTVQIEGSDYLDGGTGDDVIYANGGDDILVGGTGNDTLIGGAGQDTYIYNKGDGVDWIYDTQAEHNILRFGAGINSSDITLTLGSLMLNLGNGDAIHINNESQANASGFDRNNVFNSSSISSFEFADGSILTIAELLARGFDLFGTMGDDILTGTNTTDRISGYAGDDTIISGEGNDTLMGGNGSDTYVFNRGDGQDSIIDGGYDTGTDTLQFGADILQGDITLRRTLNSGLEITLNGSADGISIAGRSSVFANENRIERIVFGDGSVMTSADFESLPLVGTSADDAIIGSDSADVIEGGAGSDSIQSGLGNDTIAGGLGNDTLIGGLGNDTYVYNQGDGADSIVDHELWQTPTGVLVSDTNKLRFGVGITVDMITSLYDSVTGNVTLDLGSGDSIAIGSLNDFAIQTLQFADGTSLGLSEFFAQRPLNITGTNATEIITGTNFNDVITGGKGNDALSGNLGNDTYVYNLGDGADTIDDSAVWQMPTGELVSDTNTLRFGAGITADAITTEVDAVSGQVMLNMTDGGSIAIGSRNNLVIQRLQFSDGSSLVMSEFLAQHPLNTTTGTVTGATLIGTDAADTLVGTGLKDTISALGGDDVVIAGAGDDVVYGGDGNDTIDGGSGNNTLYGDGGNDTLTAGAGYDLLDGGSGADTMAGGAGDDTYYVDNAGDLVVEQVNAGTDIVYSSINYTLTDNVENLTLTGPSTGSGQASANINATGNAQDNLITGNGGDNVLDGGAGADIMDGGLGNDTYVVDNLGDQVLESQVGSETAGGYWDYSWVLSTAYWVQPYVIPNIDTVNASVNYTLGTNLENLNLTGATDINGTGNGYDNVINGNVGSNILQGGDGNDTLNGGSGADVLIGGAGNDTYIVDNVGDRIIEDVVGQTISGGQWVWDYYQGMQYQPYSYFQTNIEMVYSSVDWTLGANLENLVLTGHTLAGLPANLNGTGNGLDNIITGNAGDNVLAGLAGNDTLNGGAGNDTLSGGAGNDVLDGGAGLNVLDGGSGDDTYHVSNTADTIIEAVDGGIDTVIATADYMLGDNVETLQLQGAAISGTGNAQDNTLTGNELGNVLDGQAGNDSLDGGLGNDMIDGGAGDDALLGGSDSYWGNPNNDTLYGGDGNDYVDGGSGDDVIDGGAGNDILLGGNDGGTPDGEGGYNSNGLSNNDTISGGEGNDTIDGQSGADILYGGTGDDVIYGGDNTQQTDYYDPATDTWMLMSNNDTLDGGDGNDLLYGEQGDDVLLGGAGNDMVDGGDGNDLLDGGAGLDTLIGGTGEDTYVVDGTYTKVAATTLNECGDVVPVERLQWTTDNVTELGGEGYDIVKSSASYSLAANAEALQLVFDPNTATTDPQYYADLMAYGQDGTGNELDNVIIGNDLNNRLDGGMGADTLAGGSGNDTYVVNNIGDTLIEQIGGGIDTVASSLSYSLASTNLENLTLTGTDNLDGTGNAADNIINGNAGYNALFGGDGNDTLIANGGGDDLYGGAGNDRYIFRVGDGNVWIFDDQGVDTVFVGNDLTVASLAATRIGDDLVMTVTGTTDSVTVINWFVQTEGVSRIEFCNGTSLDRTGMEALFNAPPVANSDQITVSQNDTRSTITAAALLANDTDPNVGDSISLVGFDALSAQGNNVVQDGNGNLALEIGNRYQSLAAGETATDSFTYTISDLAGATSSATVDVTIAGINDAPVVATAMLNQSTQQDAAFSYTVPVSTFTDIDHGDVLTYSATLADGTTLPSWLTFDVATQTFSGVPSNWDVGNLSVLVTATDTGGLSASSTFALDIANVNDAPTANADTGNASEDGGAALFNVATLLANDTDPDFIHGDTLNIVGVSQAMSGAAVSLVNGAVQYDIGNRFQALAQGQAASDTFSYTISDTAGAVSTATVTMTITGVNDAPTTVNDSANVQEDTLLAATGNVLSNDSDVDQGTILTVANAGTLQGQYGSLLLQADGSYTYALDNASLAVQSLAQGQTVIETFSYQASDGITTTPATLTVSITGTNDAPVAAADAAAVQEDLNIMATGNVLSNDSDVDQGTVLTVANAGTLAGNYGNLVLNANGSYSYALNNTSLAVQSLAQGQLVTETFSYAATDGITVTPSTLTVTIKGTNDAPVVVADTAAVQEDLTITATGNVLTNDSDVDQGTVLSVANAGVFAGQYGQLTLQADGSYTYALDNAALSVQSLAAGQVVTETFAYQATDGITSTPSTLTVTIKGTNDAPVVAIPLSNQSVQQASAFNFTLPANAFTDIDKGDILTYTATLNDGTTLPSWLTFNAATRTFSGTAGDPGSLGLHVVATDLAGASASGNFTLNVAQTCTPGKTIEGSCGDDTLTATKGDDTLDGQNGADAMTGGAGNDTYLVDNVGDKVVEKASLGIDTIKSSVSYTLSAHVENLTLTGNSAINATDNAQHNLLTGNSANNVLTAGSGNNLLDGGSGSDTLTGNSGNEMFIGGAGNDTINTGNGADTIAFNRGDGMDVVNGGIASDNTISLGGGIRYSDIALSKVNNDLILEVGQTSSGKSERITLANWYNTSANYKSVIDLQVMADAIAGFSSTSSDPLMNRAVQNFDFSAIANAFDQARGSSSTLMHWKATNSLLAAHLSGSDTAALGGDLAHQYGTNGSMSGMNLIAAQDVLNVPQFGAQAQALHPLQGLQGGASM
jgi:VCBS repeat-containing protein